MRWRSCAARLPSRFSVKGENDVANKIVITLTRGLAGKEKSQIATCKALGLKKTNSSVEQPDNPAIRGMIAKVAHLVTVTEG